MGKAFVRRLKYLWPLPLVVIGVFVFFDHRFGSDTELANEVMVYLRQDDRFKSTFGNKVEIRWINSGSRSLKYPDEQNGYYVYEIDGPNGGEITVQWHKTGENLEITDWRK